MPKYTRIPENTFTTIQRNAGVLATTFNTESGELLDTDILGATSGGINFSVTPSFKDYAEDIDNAAKNMKEFKIQEDTEVKISGDFASASTELLARLAGAADVKESGHIVPRNDLKDTDFKDLWFIGDYGTDQFIAIHMLNTLNTGGFQLQTTDKEKGKFAFEFTAHYSITDQDKVPYEIYVGEVGE